MIHLEKNSKSVNEDEKRHVRSQASKNSESNIMDKLLLIERPVPAVLFRWALWKLNFDRKKTWEECLTKVAVFNDYDGLWALQKHQVVPSPCGLIYGSDYYLFKEGIKPSWEDERNKKGGRWVLSLSKYDRWVMDAYWMRISMAITGDHFGPLNHYICGAVVNVRQKGDKIAIWTADETLDEINIRIGWNMRAILGLVEDELIYYEAHSDLLTRTKDNWRVKSKLVLPQLKPRCVNSRVQA